MHKSTEQNVTTTKVKFPKQDNRNLTFLFFFLTLIVLIIYIIVYELSIVFRSDHIMYKILTDKKI